MTFTDSKHPFAPASQTPAETAFARPSEDTWRGVAGFPSGTSGAIASPSRASEAERRDDAFGNEWAPTQLPLVLLAHADETRRGGLAWELGAQGCTVVEVEDGRELLDYLDEQGPWLPLPRPDVIVAELDMPGCGGLEAACALRRSGDLTPIVFLIALHTPAAAVAAARLPACRVLHGEVEGGLLRAAVEEALRSRTP